MATSHWNCLFSPDPKLNFQGNLRHWIFLFRSKSWSKSTYLSFLSLTFWPPSSFYVPACLLSYFNLPPLHLPSPPTNPPHSPRMFIAKRFPSRFLIFAELLWFCKQNVSTSGLEEKPPPPLCSTGGANGRICVKLRGEGDIGQ